MTTVAELADPVWALIDAIANVNTYDAEIVDADGNPITPPLDVDGRVHAYAVYYPGPGWFHALLADGAGDSLDWTFRVNCVGGDRTRLLWCVERVRAALTGKRLSVGGQQLVIREEPSSGSLSRNDQVSPPRHFTSVLFTLNA